jgi:hypothetical protein
MKPLVLLSLAVSGVCTVALVRAFRGIDRLRSLRTDDELRIAELEYFVSCTDLEDMRQRISEIANRIPAVHVLAQNCQRRIETLEAADRCCSVERGAINKRIDKLQKKGGTPKAKH